MNKLIMMILMKNKKLSKRQIKSQLKVHGYSNLTVILEKRSRNTSFRKRNKRRRSKFSPREVLLKIQRMIQTQTKMSKRKLIRMMTESQQRKCTNVDHLLTRQSTVRFATWEMAAGLTSILLREFRHVSTEDQK